MKCDNCHLNYPNVFEGKSGMNFQLVTCIRNKETLLEFCTPECVIEYLETTFKQKEIRQAMLRKLIVYDK